LELLVNGKAVDALARLVPSGACFPRVQIGDVVVSRVPRWCLRVLGRTQGLQSKGMRTNALAQCSRTMHAHHARAQCTHAVTLRAATADAARAGRALASRLKGLLDRQQYEVVIQVRVRHE
jgi:hypothetical protein